MQFLIEHELEIKQRLNESMFLEYWTRLNESVIDCLVFDGNEYNNIVARQATSD